MIPYWTIFAFAALFSLRDLRLPIVERARASHLIVIVIALMLMIGLRYRVGGDWTAYEGALFDMRYRTLIEALGQKDPGYQLINLIVSTIDVEIWLVNLICAIIFSVGLLRFVQTLPSPALAVAVAVPYFVIVVGMGYTRQAAAIGFVMLAINALRSDRLARVTVYIVLAVLFHRTAVIIIPMIAMARTRNKFATLIAAAALGIALYFAFLDSSIDHLVAGYVESQYDSSGATVRVMMNLVPAVVFLLLGRRFQLLNRDEWMLWRNFAFAALACVPGLFLAGSTTVVDRLALYLIPLQLFVLSWLPHVIGRESGDNRATVAAIILYSSAIQFVWLNFASHNRYWIPYQLYPLTVPQYQRA